jgi:hypothetical protein
MAIIGIIGGSGLGNPDLPLNPRAHCGKRRGRLFA